MPRPEADEALRRFRQDVHGLLGRIDLGFPDGTVKGDATPMALDWPLKPLKDGIDDILGGFDALQIAMGLDPDKEYPRHRRFLCPGICEEEEAKNRLYNPKTHTWAPPGDFERRTDVATADAVRMFRSGRADENVRIAIASEHGYDVMGAAWVRARIILGKE